MVRLTVTPTIQAAWKRAQCSTSEADLTSSPIQTDTSNVNDSEKSDARKEETQQPAIGDPVAHDSIIQLSRTLRKSHPEEETYRLSNLLKGSNVYIDPPKPKPEPTPEFKALMARLRREQEEASYERMTTQKEEALHGPIGATDKQTEDEVTYADVNRQLTLVLNVVISIVFCAVAIWMASWHWSVPKRLFASMGGGIVVGVAEVVIYAGYLRRIKEAKTEERKKKEIREVTPLFRIDRKEKAA